MSAVTAREARRWEVSGTVQGVGFRPFVYRLATSLGISGAVRNAGGSVIIDAVGDGAALTEFARRLRDEAPPLASITAIAACDPDDGYQPSEFVVDASVATAGAREIPPDTATCDECLSELFDPADRRYRYPFLNCTSCGPRATIIDDLPYDRTHTSMADFAMCEDCDAEYHNPVDRRFHAQPVACPACGPVLTWASGVGAAASGELALQAAVTALRAGGIVALKGLGGYQLACDATDDDAVTRLRERKHRPDKPFAVMAADPDAALRLAYLSEAERELLVAPARPIVLARPRHGRLGPARSVRAGAPYLGVFLPATPLHHLMLRGVGRPLVVTSGNVADEPIVIDDATAFTHLGRVADGVLTHDRPILARYDDSVTWVVASTPAVLRRARGYAPAPLPLPTAAPRPLLAVGAQLKHTFALAAGDRAIVSPHTGDLADTGTLDAVHDALCRLRRVHDIEPSYVAHDLHPEYLSTKYAARFPADRRIAVQHHHAHIASCAAEHGITEAVIGVAYDGLGLGDDGTLWGGEVLLADLTGYRRLARFGRAPLPGGAAAIRHPARMALGYLVGAEDLGGPAIPPDVVDVFARRLDQRQVTLVRRMTATSLVSPLASSAGRLFDAAASLLGLRDDISFEGEAALALEAAAGRAGERRVAALPWRLASVDDLAVYDPRPTLGALLEGVARGESVSSLAAAFHATVAEVTQALVRDAAGTAGHRPVCLSGGVWQNRLLTESVLGLLRADGFDVHVNQRVPTNDGGISYGQAAVAAARLSGG